MDPVSFSAQLPVSSEYAIAKEMERSSWAIHEFSVNGVEVNRYHHSAASMPFILSYFETPSSLLAFLVVASKLGKFKLLCSLG